MRRYLESSEAEIYVRNTQEILWAPTIITNQKSQQGKRREEKEKRI